MKSFLTLRSVEEVLALIGTFSPLDTETVPLDEAAGRWLAQDWHAPEDLPGFDRSTVDGWAVHARDVFGAQEGSPALLECSADLSMGKAPDAPLEEGHAARILTGGMLPEGADCGVRVEHSRPVNDALVELVRTQAPGDHVIFRDDDAAKGALLDDKGLQSCMACALCGIVATGTTTDKGGWMNGRGGAAPVLILISDGGGTRPSVTLFDEKLDAINDPVYGHMYACGNYNKTDFKLVYKLLIGIIIALGWFGAFIIKVLKLDTILSDNVYSVLSTSLYTLMGFVVILFIDMFSDGENCYNTMFSILR